MKVKRVEWRCLAFRATTHRLWICGGHGHVCRISRNPGFIRGHFYSARAPCVPPPRRRWMSMFGQFIVILLSCPEAAPIKYSVREKHFLIKSELNFGDFLILTTIKCSLNNRFSNDKFYRSDLCPHSLCVLKNEALKIGSLVFFWSIGIKSVCMGIFFFSAVVSLSWPRSRVMLWCSLCLTRVPSIRLWIFYATFSQVEDKYENNAKRCVHCSNLSLHSSKLWSGGCQPASKMTPFL